jgi:hypothetical protein
MTERFTQNQDKTLFFTMSLPFISLNVRRSPTFRRYLRLGPEPSPSMVDLRPLRPAPAYRSAEAIGQFGTDNFQRRDFREPADSVRESRSGG